MNWKFWQSKHLQQVAKILADPRNKEDFLGMKGLDLPNPKDIRDNAAALVRYSKGADYKRFADETWARVMTGIDKILDERSSNEVRQYHCGSVKAMLDLLRLSYQARQVVDEFDKHQMNANGPTTRL